MSGNVMEISVIPYTDDKFEVIIRDPGTGEEVALCGRQTLTQEQLDLLDRLAPACVWRTYKEHVYSGGGWRDTERENILRDLGHK